MSQITTQQPDYLVSLNKIIADVIEKNAIEVDAEGRFPRENINALADGNFLGFISATEVGGGGHSLRDAAMVVERIAQVCASTGMILCMHYCGVAVIEAYGQQAVREVIAKNQHLTTLALSEKGSRSHFWIPVSTAAKGEQNGQVELNAEKSWSTSAGEADSYVWSSKPLTAEGNATLWLVPGKAQGLQIPKPFDGLGLRGNSSCPITATQVLVDEAAMLGLDGGGFDIIMSIVTTYFLVLASAVSIGLMNATTAKATAHISQTRFQHLNQTLSDLPTIRAYIARMKVKTDMVGGLLLDTLTALEDERDDALLKLFEVKAAAGETSTEVTDLGMRVCGGAAFRKEVGIERHFRDARAATVMSPTTDILYDLLGRLVSGMPLFE